ncbi:hypothetical protein EDB89DRAFT_2246322 [Lactarius sanguifluus]|nr:hypothetical protein EDB89DRAFT_2246322 [Lactarius sanguifluus]
MCSEASQPCPLGNTVSGPPPLCTQRRRDVIVRRHAGRSRLQWALLLLAPLLGWRIAARRRRSGEWGDGFEFEFEFETLENLHTAGTAGEEVGAVAEVDADADAAAGSTAPALSFGLAIYFRRNTRRRALDLCDLRGALSSRLPVRSGESEQDVFPPKDGTKDGMHNENDTVSVGLDALCTPTDVLWVETMRDKTGRRCAVQIRKVNRVDRVNRRSRTESNRSMALASVPPMDTQQPSRRATDSPIIYQGNPRRNVKVLHPNGQPTSTAPSVSTGMFRRNVQIRVEDFGGPDNNVFDVADKQCQEHHLGPLGDDDRSVRLEIVGFVLPSFRNAAVAPLSSRARRVITAFVHFADGFMIVHSLSTVKTQTR